MPQYIEPVLELAKIQATLARTMESLSDIKVAVDHEL